MGATTTEGTGPGSVDKILPTIKNGRIYLSNIVNIKSLLDGVLVLEEFEPNFQTNQASPHVDVLHHIEQVQTEQVVKRQIQISQSFNHSIKVHNPNTSSEIVLPLSLEKKESYKIIVSKKARVKNRLVSNRLGEKQKKQRKKIIRVKNRLVSNRLGEKQKKQRKKIISSEVLLIGNNQKIVISKSNT